MQRLHFSQPQAIFFSSDNPSLLSSDNSTLRFSVDVHLNQDPPLKLIEIPGFRIKGGKVIPPARKLPKGDRFVPTVELLDDMLDAISDLASTSWAEDFPTVVFPKVKKS